MAGRVTGYGDGHGAGSGDGFGSGYGVGYGDAYGYGDGYGYGYGSGYGSGYGYGDGSGSGFGSGYGSGYGDSVTSIAGHDVRLLRPWGLVAVGCRVHTIAHWRERWREIAEAEGVEVSEDEAKRLLAYVERLWRVK